MILATEKKYQESASLNKKEKTMELKQFVPYEDDPAFKSQKSSEPQEKKSIKITLAFRAKKAQQKKNLYLYFLVAVLVVQILALGWLIKKNHFSASNFQSIFAESSPEKALPSSQQKKKATPSANKSRVTHMPLANKSL